MFKFNRDISNYPNLKNKHVSEATYYRIFISEYLPKNLEEIIYLDSDVFCINNSNQMIDNIFNELKERISLNKSHVIDFEELSTRERMTEILELLQQGDLIAFNDLIKKSEGKMGVAVVLLAIMELLKDSLIKGIQNEPFGKIHLSKKISGIH